MRENDKNNRGAYIPYKGVTASKLNMELAALCKVALYSFPSTNRLGILTIPFMASYSTVEAAA